MAVYDEVVRRFGEATEPRHPGEVAMALVNKGVVQGELTSPADAVAVYDEVVRRFGEATEPGIREMVAMAPVKKGVAQREPTRPADAFSPMTRWCGASAKPPNPAFGCRWPCVVSKGLRSGTARPPADEMTVYDEVVGRFGDATEPGIRPYGGFGSSVQGYRAGNLTPPADAVAAYDEVVRRFGEATEPGFGRGGQGAGVQGCRAGKPHVTRGRSGHL